MEITTIGRTLLQDAVPPELRASLPAEFDKKGTQAFFKELAEKQPEQYIDVLQRLMGIAQLAGTEYGGVASLRLKDLRTPAAARKMRDGLRQQVQVIAQDPDLDSREKNERIIALVGKQVEGIHTAVRDEADRDGSAFALSIKKGYRGSPAQLTQLLFGDLLMADQRGRTMPLAGLHGYGEGVTPMEYWSGSYASRKGFFDQQFATARSGYLAKQLSQTAQRLKITEDDCGTEHGLPYDGNDSDNIGAVLASPVKGFPKGTVITKDMLPKLAGQQVVVRGISTCDTARGVCKRCAGQRDQGHFPPSGSYIGISSARIVTEPMTQELGLSAKHLGGIANLNDENLSAFDEINQFLQVPEMFIGGAALAPVDGKVTGISKAPQGGNYVRVGAEQVHVPEGRAVTVGLGQEVTAGDVLSDGTPNPAEIVKHKGIGAGKRYFIRQFTDMLKDRGVPTHRRNVDTLARAFFDHVRVTNADGLDEHEVGDVASYAELQKNWKPRAGSVELSADDAVGRYLERPEYYFTIGTRITRPVAKELREAGHRKIIVHRDPPGFEPEITRLLAHPSMDPDWKVRLGGFGLKSGLLASATKGSVSEPDSTSPVPMLMNPALIE